jgi:PII-like signaling protein
VELTGQAVLMRIFVGESDKVGHAPLYERIVQGARSSGLAGATAWKGVTGFGANSIIRTARVLDLSADLPVVIELVDEETKITAFQQTLDELFQQADCGGLVTIERVNVHRYLASNGQASGAGHS